MGKKMDNHMETGFHKGLREFTEPMRGMILKFIPDLSIL